MGLKIALLGDVCLTGKFDSRKNVEAVRQLDEMRSLLARYDVVLANLESPLTDKKTSNVCKAIHIKSPPENVSLLKYIGVTAVSLANNHMFDYGYAGHESTRVALDSVGIDYYGTQERTVTLEKNGEKILIGGFCCLSTHPSKANSDGVDVLNYKSLKGFLDSAEAQAAFPVASIHWGNENIHYPRKDHVDFARLMAGDHDFLLCGHHPHVVQGIEVQGGSLIAYSLGNFCTDIHHSRSIRDLQTEQTRANKQSCVLGVTIENGSIVDSEFISIEDIGDSITVADQKTRDAIMHYSKQLINPYSQPESGSVKINNKVRAVPARFSPGWIYRRMNYNFICAYAKGLVNRFRYFYYYANIYKKVNEKTG